MKAWHFLKENGRCGNGRLGIIEVGRTYKVKEELDICRKGLHASARLIDAFAYAPGPVLCRVELGGEIIKDKNTHFPDKMVASERTVIWMQDITKTLWQFFCAESERALRIGEITDPPFWEDVRVRRLWLKGKVDDAALVFPKNTATTSVWAAIREVQAATIKQTANGRKDFSFEEKTACRHSATIALNKRLTARVMRLMK